MYNQIFNKHVKFIVLMLGLSWWVNGLYAIQPLASGYINVDSGKIFYQTFGVGVPIIVLHGGPGLDQSYLLPQMLELARDNKVIFYDQRGCGKSQGFMLNEQTINMKIFVEDIEVVRKKLGYAKIILAGHSFGGRLAMNYAIAYPEHLKALVLIDPGPANVDGMQKFKNEYNKRIKPLQIQLDAIQNSPEFKNYDPKAVADWYRTMFSVYFYRHENVNKLTLNFTEESARNGAVVASLLSSDWQNADLIPELKKLQIPTLIVHGEVDVIPVATAVDIQQAIPDSKLVVIKNSDHFPYIDQPKKFFLAIQEFLHNAFCRET